MILVLQGGGGQDQSQEMLLPSQKCCSGQAGKERNKYDTCSTRRRRARSEPGDATAFSEMLFRASKQRENKQGTCSCCSKKER